MSSQGPVQTLRVRVIRFVRAPIQRVFAAYVDPALLAKVLISGLLRRTQEGGRLERGTRQRLATLAGLVEGGTT